MPIDYSKWDDIDTDSDDEAPKPKPKPQKAAATTTPASSSSQPATAAHPKPTSSSGKKGDKTESAAGAGQAQHAQQQAQAQGSSWNVNSWHFEETKLDDWGCQRLREHLHKAKVEDRIEHQGVEVELVAKLVVKEVTGECWIHIRKGKKVLGYDFDVKVDWAGQILGGSGLQVHGFVEYMFTVDDDEEDILFRMAQDVPFKDQIGRAVKGVVSKKCAAFVKDLAAKEPSGGDKAGAGGGEKRAALEAGANVQVGQYQKYTEGPDGVAALQERARQMSLREEEAREAGGEGEGGVKKRDQQKRLHTLAPTL